MSRTSIIHAAVTRELDRRKRWIDAESDLRQVIVCVKFDKRGNVQSVQVNTGSEREIEEQAC